MKSAPELPVQVTALPLIVQLAIADVPLKQSTAAETAI
jgi:hypothetical protein